MTKKRKRKASKHKIRLVLAFLVFASITSVLGYNLLSNVKSINELVLQKKELKIKINDLKVEKEDLQTDIKKLEDADYIARYVREKYMYSKDGELILRMKD